MGSKKKKFRRLSFIDLRDRTGLLQVVFGEAINKEAFEKADLAKSEYCIAVKWKDSKKRISKFEFTNWNGRA